LERWRLELRHRNEGNRKANKKANQMERA